MNKRNYLLSKTTIMKKYLLLLLATMGLFTSCRKIEKDAPINPNPSENERVLVGKISSDLTLKSGNTYTLRGIVYVVNGAELTIEAGTRIEGEKGTTTRGTLVITRGAKIIADGTREKPIVFTSDQQNPQSGDWGGLVILGNAPTNASFNGKEGEGAVEGGVNNAEGLGLYGGSDIMDNSGVLRYLRVEYAGYAYLPDNELNSITLAGVGKGTTLEHIQVYKANDDGIECFGGNADLRYVVINSTLDDDFDTDNGWSGTLQFAIIMRDSSKADISKSESFESDNDANGSSLTPQTSGTVSNITIIGPRATSSNTGNSLYLAGMQLRRNTSLSVFNSVIAGYGTGILIDGSKGTPTDLNIQAGNLQIQNTVIAGAEKPLEYSKSASAPTGWDKEAAQSWFLESANGNSIIDNNESLKIKDPFNYLNPDFSLMEGSPLLSEASFSSERLSGFKPVTFKGATGKEGTPEGEWWKGWTKLEL